MFNNKYYNKLLAVFNNKYCELLAVFNGKYCVIILIKLFIVIMVDRCNLISRYI